MSKAFTDLKAVMALIDSDIGKWVTYNNGFKQEMGKIKSFDNRRQVAWVAYNCRGRWESGRWKNYTAACTSYSDLTFF